MRVPPAGHQVNHGDARRRNGTLREHGQRESIDTLTGNPLWQVLPAVSSDRAFENVPAGVTSSFIWGEQNLDDLEGVLAEIRASYP